MTTFLDTTEHLLDRLMDALIALVALSIAGFVILIPLNMLLIKQGLTPIWWITEGIEYALYVGVFLGAPWVLKQGAHVRVDLFATLLPPRASQKLEQITNLFGAAICVTLVFYGTRSTMWEYVDGTLPNKDLRIANWYMMAVFAFSFSLMALEFLFRLRRTETESPDKTTEEKA